MAGRSPDALLQMYAGMLRVRLFEERVRALFAAGRIPGFLHTSIGQEATAVGVASALRPDDYVLSTHRGHGHLVAKGGALRALMAELYGKATGICHGKGSSIRGASCRSTGRRWPRRSARRTAWSSPKGSRRSPRPAPMTSLPPSAQC